MNRFQLLRPVVVLLAALGIVTFPARAWAEERQHFSRGTALLDESGDFVGVGHATHLGNYDEVGFVSISGDNPEALQLEGWATYTTRNGAELCATFTGELNFFTGAIVATLIYDGGSGRFEDAIGTATLVGQLGPEGLSVTVEGTVDY